MSKNTQKTLVGFFYHILFNFGVFSWGGSMPTDGGMEAGDGEWGWGGGRGEICSVVAVGGAEEGGAWKGPVDVRGVVGGVDAAHRPQRHPPIDQEMFSQQIKYASSVFTSSRFRMRTRRSVNTRRHCSLSSMNITNPSRMLPPLILFLLCCSILLPRLLPRHHFRKRNTPFRCYPMGSISPPSWTTSKKRPLFAPPTPLFFPHRPLLCPLQAGLPSLLNCLLLEQIFLLPVYVNLPLVCS